ncbi:hypothetical protein M569_05791, partial [Genlisea aurea]
MDRNLVLVYEEEKFLGEMEVKAVDAAVFSDEIKEIRISHYSESSGRCPPLAVLHTITSAGICFKLESPARNLHSPLALMHATCLRDNKAAVTFIGEEEVQLVAMQSRKYEGQCPFFWGFNVSSSLYNSCVVMLDLRCLGIVFDLDETLVVANTMRSFEDRIDSLQRKMGLETDPQRVSGMLAEVKRYQEDKIILKQYAETDQVTDNGKVYKAQSEVVLAMSDDQQTIIRPLIRLQDKNIILTRINPLIRDTSVLVRLRPAWEDLRSYLTAKGRKRFEVFVCTMAERDYALEMWRLLDPESSLINLMDLSNRIVCVKSGSRKSLFNVFQDGTCHPKMALVIDDRLKVWDEKDQSRVHVVPAFTPYFAPQAEANNVTPILCVARNVACNVRGSFFKDFDDGLLPRISEVAFEDDAKDMPSTPDVGNYLTSEDDNSGGSTAYKDVLVFDAMADLEVERRVKDAAPAASTVATQIIGLDPRLASALQYVLPSSSFSVVPPKAQVPDLPPPLTQQVAKLIKPPLPQHGQMETILHNSPGREEGEVPESELDPDTRRRLLILQHGQDVREPPPNEPPFAGRPPPLQVPPPRVTQPGWFPVEDEMSMRQLNRAGPSMEFNGEIPMGRHRSHHPPFLHKAADSSIFMGRPRKNLRKEELASDDQLRSNQPSPNFHHFSRSNSVAKLSSLDKGLDFESGQIDPSIETFAGALHEIGLKCGTKV